MTEQCLLRKGKPPLHLVSYKQARPQIRSADILLFRPNKPRGIGRLIARAGRSEYSHAGMAAWWHGNVSSASPNRLMCLDTMQMKGGRATLLSNLVKQAPGRIDVYTSSLECHETFGSPIPCDCWKIVNAMIGMTGKPYGWKSLLKVATLHLPVLRLFRKASTDDSANGSLPFCSDAIARAYRAGGIDLVPNLADKCTEPGDLARSAFLQYKFTLK